MTPEIERLAKEAGFFLYDLTETHGVKTVESDGPDEWEALAKFAALIAEECAKVCDELDAESDYTYADECAAVIRTKFARRGRRGQMKKNGRPKGAYGKNTLDVVGIIKEHGPITFRQVLPLTGDISPTVARDTCRSAVKHGLLTFDKSQRPGIYTAVA